MLKKVHLTLEVFVVTVIFVLFSRECSGNIWNKEFWGQSEVLNTSKVMKKLTLMLTFKYYMQRLSSRTHQPMTPNFLLYSFQGVFTLIL